MVNPTFDFVSGQGEDSDSAYVGFLAALLDDPAMVPALDHYFADQYEAYYQALRRARPDLSREEAVNRACFALHLVLNTGSEPARGLGTWIERHHPPSVERIRSDLIDFLAGAFAAP
jgi:hypothetical protein